MSVQTCFQELDVMISGNVMKFQFMFSRIDQIFSRGFIVEVEGVGKKFRAFQEKRMEKRCLSYKKRRGKNVIYFMILVDINYVELTSHISDG